MKVVEVLRYAAEAVDHPVCDADEPVAAKGVAGLDVEQGARAVCLCPNTTSNGE